MIIETTHLYRDTGLRYFEEHQDKCNAAKSNKNLSSLIRCDCKVFYSTTKK